MTTGVSAPSVEDRLAWLCTQVEHIAAELSIQGESRERWQELGQTLMPLSHSAFDLASRELEELSVDVTVDDAVRFARSMARALPQLEVLLAQIAQGQSAQPDPPTALGLLKQLRDPQTRRGLARALSLLQALGADPTSDPASNAHRKR